VEGNGWVFLDNFKMILDLLKGEGIFLFWSLRALRTGSSQSRFPNRSVGKCVGEVNLFYGTREKGLLLIVCKLEGGVI
jgi:hypothetical protein